MDKNCPACFNPRETRVIVQYKSKVQSFRLLKDCPGIVSEANPLARIGLARLMAGEAADPEDIVSLVLDETDHSKLYRCGGPGEFEPVPGKVNYWVTDLVHRDRTAPKLSAVRDAWEYNYQIFPHKLLDAVCKDVVKAHHKNKDFQKILDLMVRIDQEKRKNEDQDNNQNGNNQNGNNPNKG